MVKPQGGRTKFYREMLKPLALGLGTLIEEQLETGSELFKVDFAISRNSDSVKIPIIFIESENNAYSADHEVRKDPGLAWASAKIALSLERATKWKKATRS